MDVFHQFIEIRQNGRAVYYIMMYI